MVHIDTSYRTKLCIGLLFFALIAVATSGKAILAQSVPDIGWQTTFSEDFHDVSGIVTVVDEDTLLFDDFTYDGGGIVVYFYLGANDTSFDFTNGLPIGQDLFGTVFDGSQAAFTVDLPIGTTIDGYNAISVWCVAAGVSFGSGTFAAPASVPEPTSVSLLLGGMLLGRIAMKRRDR